MDSLAKELIRFQQERKIVKMVEVAETNRKIREIEESGKRQVNCVMLGRRNSASERRRPVPINHGRALGNSGQLPEFHDGQHHRRMYILNEASRRQALMMTRIRKEQIRDPVHQLERLRHNHETIIRDLMSQFLIPNVNRQ